MVLSGADATGTFYAVQSLRQLLAPIQSGQGQGPAEAGRGFPGVVLRDWPTGAPVRGTAESFYGTPWTTAERLEQLDFLGRTKQNFFLYAPGADPYRTSRWREAYPQAQQDALRRLAARARDNHVVLGYSIDPGQSFCYGSGKDVDALVAKLDGLRRLGFGAFQLQFLDVSYDEWHCPGDRRTYGTGPAAAAKAQAELAAKVQTRLIAAHPELAPLSVVPTEYQKQGATPYRKALAAALPQGVQVAWSGGAVIAPKVTGDQLAQTAALFDRPLVTMDNYPVNDSTPDRLFLGGYTSRDPAVATRSAVLLTAAMAQPVASRLPLATAADFGWKPEGYRAEDSVKQAVHAMSGGGAAEAALAALAGNSSSSPLDKRESGYLAPLMERFWTALEPSSGSTPDHAALQAAAAPLQEAFATMAGAPQALAGDAVAQDAGPWLVRLATYGRAGQAAVAMLLAQRGGDGSAAWQARVDLRQLREQLGQGTVTLGAGVLDPFLERALKDADTWAAWTLLGHPDDHDRHGQRPRPGTDDGRRRGHLLLERVPAAGRRRGRPGPRQRPPARPGDRADGLVGRRSGRGERGRRLPARRGAGVLHGQRRLEAAGGGARPEERVGDRPGRHRGQGGAAARADGAEDRGGRPGVLGRGTGRHAGGGDRPGRGAGLLAGRGAGRRPGHRVPRRGRADGGLGAADGGAGLGPPAGPGHRADRPDGAGGRDGGGARRGRPLDGDRHAEARLQRAPGGRPPGRRDPAGVGARLPGAGGQPDRALVRGHPGGAAQPLGLQPGRGDRAGRAAGDEGGAGDRPAGGHQRRAEGGGAGGRQGADRHPGHRGGGAARRPGGRAAAGGGGRRDALGHLPAAGHVHRGHADRPAGPAGARGAADGGPDLARGATATSSADETPAFPASNINDGDPRTRWSSPASDGAWVQLALPQAARLGSAVLHWQDAHAAAYKVQTSADGVTWTTVATVDDGGGGTETVRFDAPGTRYLRVQGVTRATKYGYSLWGVELYAVTG
ncbi:beta-N-acetylglucosaminidase domain-containing protein [Kitasatospora arboriphila]